MESTLRGAAQDLDIEIKTSEGNGNTYRSSTGKKGNEMVKVDLKCKSFSLIKELHFLKTSGLALSLYIFFK